MAARPPAVTVLYDHDCGFCRWSVGRLLAWDRAGRLRPLAIQSAEGQRLLADLTPEQRLASAHAVDAAGTADVGRRRDGAGGRRPARRRAAGRARAPRAGARPRGLPRRGRPALALRQARQRRGQARADERIAQRSASST